MPKKTGKFAAPPSVEKSLSQLGQRIRIARLRRGMTVSELAVKAGINRNTLTNLELGRPGVAVGGVVTVLWALGLDNSLDGVAHPDTDAHGKALEASRRGKRARPASTNDYDF